MRGGRWGFGSVGVLYLLVLGGCGGDRGREAPVGDAGQARAAADTTGLSDTARGINPDSGVAVAPRDTAVTAAKPAPAPRDSAPKKAPPASKPASPAPKPAAPAVPKPATPSPAARRETLRHVHGCRHGDSPGLTSGRECRYAFAGCLPPGAPGYGGPGGL